MKILKYIRKAIRYIFDSDYRFRINSLFVSNCNMTDEEFIQRMFKAKMGYPLNLVEPTTFNEKLQWLKLNDRRSEYRKMVDKYEAKGYVASILGEDIVIPTLGVWNRFEDINFDILPKQFVLKCTHDSGGIFIVKDKNEFSISEARKKISKCLKKNYYWKFHEWPYKDLEPRVIAEDYINDSETRELIDYKIFCFNGVPRIILVCKDRFSNTGMTEDFFDTNWIHLDVRREHKGNAKDNIERPEQLDTMLQYASRLAKGIPFLRTDFYIVNSKIFFGELTFYPAGGFERFIPDSFDKLIGDWLVLSDNDI